MPDLFIITGPNGSGKSTAGFLYLPEYLQGVTTIFDGDKLFLNKKRELYPSSTPSIKEAGRQALEWLHEEFERRVSDAIKHKLPFIYEGHLPEKANWITPQRFKNAGYNVNMIFLGLENVELSILRVYDRAKMGGHNVPPYEVERNYYGNLKELNNNFQILDSLTIIDTSESTQPKLLGIFKNGIKDFSVSQSEIPEWFKDELTNIFNLLP